MPEPTFFVDRSLGRRQLPSLLRQGGWSLITLAEHYGIPADEGIDDVDWLELAGARGWPVLMKDERIRYRAAERKALIDHDVRAFCLTSGNLTAAQMAESFSTSSERIWRLALAAGPALFAVSRSKVEPLALDG